MYVILTIEQLGVDRAVVYMYIRQEDARNGDLAKIIRISANQTYVTGLMAHGYYPFVTPSGTLTGLWFLVGLVLHVSNAMWLLKISSF